MLKIISPSRRFALILAVVLAFIAAVLVKVYLDQQSAAIKKQEREKLLNYQASQAQVLVAKKDIPKGATVEADALELTTVPKNYIQPRAVNSVESIAGMVAAVPISKGEQITMSKFVSSGQQAIAAGDSLAMLTPIGKRAISLPVDNISSLMGMIRPGDYVDVIAMLPVPAETPDGKQISQAVVMPLFQNVQVLAVGQNIARQVVSQSARYQQKEEPKDTASTLITLALSPQEAYLLAFVQEQGKIRLILRSPADSQINPVQTANWDTLFQYLMPQMMQQPQADSAADAGAQKPAPRTVEIYRGLKKEVITLSK